MAIINGTFLPDILIGTSEDDTINGFGGLDTIAGGDGHDVIDGGDGDDVLIGGDGNDILIGGPGAATNLSLYNGGIGNDLMIASDLGVAEDFDGGDGIDTVSFAARDSGVTVFMSVLGIPLLDTLRNVENVIGSSFDDELTADGGNNVLDGADGNDVLDGGGGNDVLIGGIGADAMTGGTGDDIYYLDNAGDTVTEFDGGGSDTVRVSTSYTLTEGSSIENAEAVDPSSVTALNLTGNSGGNNLSGNNGVNDLDGGAGADTMAGLGGNDVYRVDNAGDVVVEGPGGGNDRVVASASWTLANGVSIETLEAAAGNAAIGLTGNADANSLLGNAGANMLDGGAGADTMTGGDGSDTYYVDDAGDVVVENAGEGNDRVVVSLSYGLTAGSSIEALEAAAGTDQINLTGTAGTNSLTGNDGANNLDGAGGGDVMTGRGGDDLYYVHNAADSVIEAAGEGNDRVIASVSWQLGAGASVEAIEAASGAAAINLTGNNDANQLTGNDGNNILDGRGGDDTMTGQDGDDGYVVDSLADVVVETAGNGTDRIFAALSYTLAAGLSVETLSTTDNAGTAAIDLTGNALANSVFGNAGANVLRGGAGNDLLDGKEGDDTLHGGADDDTLYGRGGGDTLYGGAGTNRLAGGGGDDRYIVQSATDTVAELSGEGNDRVFAALSFALTAGAEVEILSTTDNAGTAAIDLTGNEFGNTIFGNAGANILNGGAGNDLLDGKDGNDTLYGGADDDTLHGGAGSDTLSGGTGTNHLEGGLGDDRYIVESGADLVLEFAGEGADRVFASTSYTLAAGVSVEILSTADNAGTAGINLTGNALANLVIGNAGANVLSGGAGNDVLDAKEGADTLDGGLGNDILYGGVGNDIFQFTAAIGGGHVDLIADFEAGLDRIALHGGIFAGTGSKGAFDANAFHVGAAAHDADDRIIYNAATGQLFYDADGDGAGAAVHFATLQPPAALIASDFIVL
ncbi:MAG TPA: calcium-binding protein [Allosphingosinicella sp.]|nr:calcium-binding protein [Allosphingosinicella sp.]